MRGGEREGRPSVPSAAAQPLRFTLSGHDDDDDDQFDSHPIGIRTRRFEDDDSTLLSTWSGPSEGIILRMFFWSSLYWEIRALINRSESYTTVAEVLFPPHSIS